MVGVVDIFGGVDAQTEYDRAHQEWLDAPKGDEKKAALKRKNEAKDKLVAANPQPHEKPVPRSESDAEPTSVDFQNCLKYAEHIGLDRWRASDLWHTLEHPQNAPFTWEILKKFRAVLEQDAIKKGTLVQDSNAAKSEIAVNDIFGGAEPEEKPDPRRDEVYDRLGIRYLEGVDGLDWFLEKRSELQHKIADAQIQYQKLLNGLGSELDSLDYCFLAQAEVLADSLLEPKKKTLLRPYGTCRFRDVGASWSIDNEAQLQTWLTFRSEKEKEDLGIKPKTWTRDLDKVKDVSERLRKEKKDGVPGLKYDEGGRRFSISVPKEGE